MTTLFHHSYIVSRGGTTIMFQRTSHLVIALSWFACSVEGLQESEDCCGGMVSLPEAARTKLTNFCIVRMECERLCTAGQVWVYFCRRVKYHSPNTSRQVHTSRTELFGALQALSIYILIRMSQGETEHNNFDSLMLAAVTVRPILK